MTDKQVIAAINKALTAMDADDLILTYNFIMDHSICYDDRTGAYQKEEEDGNDGNE